MPLIDLDIGNAYETAALPGTGDADAGAGGLTTSSMTNETDLEAYGLDAYSRGGGAGRGGGVGRESFFGGGSGRGMGRAGRGRGGGNPGNPGDESDDGYGGYDGSGYGGNGGGYGGGGSGEGGVSADYEPPAGARHALPNHAAALAGTAVDHPFWTIALIGAGLFTYKAVTKNESSENVKVSIPSFFAVGLMATAFILGEKFVFGLVQFPSVTPTMDFL